MRIVASQVALDASLHHSSSTSSSIAGQLWVGDRPQNVQMASSLRAPTNTAALARANPTKPDPPSPSNDAVEKSSSKESRIDEVTDEELLGSPNGNQLIVLKRLLETMTGRKIQVGHPRELTQGDSAEQEPTSTAAADTGTAPPIDRAGWGLELDIESTRIETSSSSFSARGSIETADGRTIAFDATYSQKSEQVTVERLSLRAGDARMKDPLVLLYSGTSAELGERVAGFDLDNDGTADTIRNISNGAYVVQDRNGNQVVDDASEVLGALSNNGFADLSALDEDQNGFVDEGDSSYADLYLWDPTTTPNAQLTRVAEAGIGALFTGQVATPAELVDAQGTLQGRVRATGIYLTESGRLGHLQQIDLAQSTPAPIDVKA